MFSSFPISVSITDFTIRCGRCIGQIGQLSLISRGMEICFTCNIWHVSVAFSIQFGFFPVYFMESIWKVQRMAFGLIPSIAPVSSSKLLRSQLSQKHVCNRTEASRRYWRASYQQKTEWEPKTHYGCPSGLQEAVYKISGINLSLKKKFFFIFFNPKISSEPLEIVCQVHVNAVNITSPARLSSVYCKKVAHYSPSAQVFFLPAACLSESPWNKLPPVLMLWSEHKASLL